MSCSDWQNGMGYWPDYFGKGKAWNGFSDENQYEKHRTRYAEDMKELKAITAKKKEDEKPEGKYEDIKNDYKKLEKRIDGIEEMMGKIDSKLEKILKKE